MKNPGMTNYVLMITRRHRRVEKYFLVAYILNDKSYAFPVILLRVVSRRFVENNFFSHTNNDASVFECQSVYKTYWLYTLYDNRVFRVILLLTHFAHARHNPPNCMSKSTHPELLLQFVML